MGTKQSACNDAHHRLSPVASRQTTYTARPADEALELDHNVRGSEREPGAAQRPGKGGSLFVEEYGVPFAAGPPRACTKLGTRVRCLLRRRSISVGAGPALTIKSSFRCMAGSRCHARARGRARCR